MVKRYRTNHATERYPRLPGVAPPHLIKQDYVALSGRTLLRCSYDVERILLMQSVESHAHTGHGVFYGQRYPNTTPQDVARALKMDPKLVPQERQALIDEVLEFVDRVISGEQIATAVNSEGEPLVRCGTLRNIEIDPHGVLQGLFLGGLRDETRIRLLAQEQYGVNIGYGKNLVVDQEAMAKVGLDGYKLAKESHEEELDNLTKAGLFAEDNEPNKAFMFVRFRVGTGASDDAAVVMAGKMLGLSAAVGCFLADAVDTLEKYVLKYSDQDADISNYIATNYPRLELTESDAVDLAYLAAIPEQMRGRLPDSSLRHLLEVDRQSDQCALESHVAFITGRPYSLMELDHGECTNLEFYQYIEERFENWKNNHH